MIKQYGGELDGLKKEYEGYTRYGLLDEIRQLKDRLKEVEKAFDMACKYIPVHTGYCPDGPDKYVTDCLKCSKNQEDWVCWKEFFLQKVKE